MILQYEMTWSIRNSPKLAWFLGKFPDLVETDFCCLMKLNSLIFEKVWLSLYKLIKNTSGVSERNFTLETDNIILFALMSFFIKKIQI